MASGDVVSAGLMPIPPAATRAAMSNRAGGSTPAEHVPIPAFDDSTDEYYDFVGALEGYGGGGIDVEFPWMSEDQTSGNVVWGVAIRRMNEDAEDLDASHTYAFNTTTDACATASGEWEYSTISFTDGADMDSLADGERFILRIFRDANNASDTMTNDAQLVWPSLVIRES